MYKTIIHTSVAAALLSWGVAAHAADKAVDPAVDSVVDTAAAAVAPDAPAIASTGVVIVTGTRAAGLTVEDSASPIQVLDASSLARTGQPDLIQALAQNLPSLNAQAFGSDMAAMTLSARLRGLSPNNTLVLVNGKRRHGTANLAVLAGAFQGGAAADLNFIPVAAIERVEVLQDGAAAQYGTDAIAGVINIILKSNYRGGSANVSGGGYMDGGGHTGDGMANIGLTPFTDAWLSLTAETKYHGFSQRGGIDPRVVDPATMAAMPSLVNAPGYPYLNKIQGDAQYRQHIFAANFGVDLGGDTELYSFATYGKKEARAFENYRMPNRLPAIYPLGFSPQETFDEEDYAFTFGIKGKVFGNWNWDLSSTYGKDVAKLGVANSANVSLFADTGATPLSFKAGEFQASQWTNNLDLRREFDAGMATPLTLALGLEHRRDTYAIVAGDAASRYKEGAQSFPGFSLTDAGKHSRNNKAVYANIAVQPVTGWTVDIAGRFEDFSDFGNAKVGLQQRLSRADAGRIVLFGHQRLATQRLRATGAEFAGRAPGGHRRPEARSVDQYQRGPRAQSGGRYVRHAGRLPDHDPRPHRRQRLAVRFGRRDQFAGRHGGNPGQWQCARPDRRANRYQHLHQCGQHPQPRRRNRRHPEQQLRRIRARGLVGSGQLQQGRGHQDQPGTNAAGRADAARRHRDLASGNGLAQGAVEPGRAVAHG
jgi:iron complex outermembrane receptor protein